MKNFKKIIAFVLCVILVFSLGACAPKGATLHKEWGFKANGKEYAVGTYLYSLAVAYESAYYYLYSSNQDVDTGDSILDMESSFDEEGKLYTAREWILKTAKDYIEYMAAVDMLMEEYDVSLQEGRDITVFESARADWFLGENYQNVIDGYADAYPLKDLYEPMGISVESYYNAKSMLDIKYDAVFARLYSKGGQREVPMEELGAFLEEEYVNYSYFTVRLYETSLDEVSQELVYVPMGNAARNDILSKLNMYPLMAKDGATLKEIKQQHKENFNLQSDDFVMEKMERFSDIAISDGSVYISEELSKALASMKDGEAKVIAIEQSDSPVALVVYKSPVKDIQEKYLSDDINYRTVVGQFKGEEFFEYLKSYTDTFELELNSEVLEAFSVEFIEKTYIAYLKKFEG